MNAIVVFVSVAFVSSVLANEPPNLEELESKEDWDEVNREICKKDHNKDIKAKIEKCMEFDPYYKIEVMTRQCEKLKSAPGSNWFEQQKGDCRYSDCYLKLSKSKEFDKLSKDAENVEEDDLIKKGYEKYKCIRKVLGMKIEE